MRVEYYVLLHVFELIISRVELHRLVYWFTESHLIFDCSKNFGYNVLVLLISYRRIDRFDLSIPLYQGCSHVDVLAFDALIDQIPEKYLTPTKMDS